MKKYLVSIFIICILICQSSVTSSLAASELSDTVNSLVYTVTKEYRESLYRSGGQQVGRGTLIATFEYLDYSYVRVYGSPEVGTYSIYPYTLTAGTITSDSGANIASASASITFKVKTKSAGITVVEAKLTTNCNSFGDSTTTTYYYQN